MASNNGLYLFLSLDIVNSTMYKTKDPDWSRLFIEIYDKTITIVKQNWTNCKLWKTLGDELLFYKKIENKKQLIDTLTQVNTISLEANQLMRLLSPNDISIKISFKTTLWSGIVSNTLGTDRAKWLYTNIWMKNPVFTNSLDFIGPDVDIGFRISKTAYKNIVLIDAKLACVFNLLIPTFAKRSKIVLFEQLKGVWDNQHYPIVWYCEDWKRLINSFEYEDKFNSKVIMWVEAENNSKLRDVNELEKIFKQIGKVKEIQAILNSINVKRLN